MHDHNKPLEAVCGETHESSAHGLVKRTHAARSVVTSGTQHGSRLENSAQPATCEREGTSRSPDDMERILASGSGNGCHEDQPCGEKRLASLGDETCQRRQPLYPQGEAEVVTPHGPVSTDNVLRLLEYQQYRCALTGRKLTPETAALDHIIPIRCDGEHLIENTQVLSKDVNRAKGSMTNAEFIEMCHKVVDHTARQNTEGEEA